MDNTILDPFPSYLTIYIKAVFGRDVSDARADIHHLVDDMLKTARELTLEQELEISALIYPNSIPGTQKILFHDDFKLQNDVSPKSSLLDQKVQPQLESITSKSALPQFGMYWAVQQNIRRLFLMDQGVRKPVDGSSMQQYHEEAMQYLLESISTKDNKIALYRLPITTLQLESELANRIIAPRGQPDVYILQRARTAGC